MATMKELETAANKLLADLKNAEAKQSEAGKGVRELKKKLADNVKEQLELMKANAK